MTKRKRSDDLEDIEDIFAEMREYECADDVTYGMRCAYANRLERALRRHDSELMMKCMKMALDAVAAHKSDT